jgi:hypothetical protein
MQVTEEPGGRCRFRWTADFLPDSLAGVMLPRFEAGCADVKRTLDAVSARAGTY